MKCNSRNPFAIFVAFLALSFLRHAQGQDGGATQSRKEFERIFEGFKADANWKSEKFAEGLQQFTTKYPTSSEALTAKLLYAGHLQALEQADRINEEQRICREVIATAPNSWQAAIARMDLAATYGFQGNYRQELTTANSALSQIDFKSLASSNDADFLGLLAIYSTSVSDLEDSFKMLSMKARMEMGDLAGAQSAMESVQNETLKRAASDGIAYRRKVLAQKQKSPEKTNQSPSGAMSPADSVGTSN